MESDPRSDMCQRILKQVEYYFSPQNLPRDRYLLSKMDDRLRVPLKVISEFPKIQQITTDVGILLSALADSKTIGIETDEANGPLVFPLNARRPPQQCLIITDHEAPDDEVLDLFGSCGVTSSNTEGKNLVVHFVSEELCKDALKTLTEQKKIKLQAKLKPEPIQYINEEDEQQRLALEEREALKRSGSGHARAEKLLELPSALRPLLVGKGGSNIRKLQEQFPSLEVDTRQDDMYIKLTADNETILEEAADWIAKFFSSDPHRRGTSQDERRPSGDSGSQHVTPPTGDLSPGAGSFNPSLSAGLNPTLLQNSQAAMARQLQLQVQQNMMQNLMMQQQMQMYGSLMNPLFMMNQARLFQQQLAAQTFAPQDMQDGSYVRELRIPTCNAGLLIGKKGAQKANLEERFNGISIKVNTDHPESAVVLIRGSDPMMVMNAAVHIMTTYGQAAMDTTRNTQNNQGKQKSSQQQQQAQQSHTPSSYPGMNPMGLSPLLGSFGGMPPGGINSGLLGGGLAAGGMPGVSQPNMMAGQKKRVK